MAQLQGGDGAGVAQLLGGGVGGSRGIAADEPESAAVDSRVGGCRGVAANGPESAAVDSRVGGCRGVAAD